MVARVNAVVEHLIARGCVDPGQVVLAGGSRGAFMAVHCAAALERVSAVVANMPATDLGILRAPELMAEGSLAHGLSLRLHAKRLTGKRLLVTIGDGDTRVGTDAAIDFCRLATRAGADVDLHVLHRDRAVAGENGHAGDIAQSVELGQAWLDRAVLA
jgi:dipeptidyl aminopeptidase/acylaminoacyl peptidase